MKERYIRQVQKKLSLSRKVKKEVLRDLGEAFDSALEHGETEQQVIRRLGTPSAFADSVAAQLGVDPAASKKRKNLFFTLGALAVAILAFSAYAVARFESVPEGAIGQADALTHIRIEGAWGPDVSRILLAAGFAAAGAAVLGIARILRKKRG